MNILGSFFFFYPNYILFLPLLPKWKHCCGNIKSLKIRLKTLSLKNLKWDYTSQPPPRLSTSFGGYAYNFITLEEATFTEQQMRSVHMMAVGFKAFSSGFSLCEPARKAGWCSSRALSTASFSDTSDTGPATNTPSVFPKEREKSYGARWRCSGVLGAPGCWRRHQPDTSGEGKAAWQEGDLGTAQQPIRGF